MGVAWKVRRQGFVVDCFFIT